MYIIGYCLFIRLRIISINSIASLFFTASIAAAYTAIPPATAIISVIILPLSASSLLQIKIPA